MGHLDGHKRYVIIVHAIGRIHARDQIRRTADSWLSERERKTEIEMSEENFGNGMVAVDF